MNKEKLIQVLRETTDTAEKNTGEKLSRVQKFEVLVSTCDNLLKENIITKAQHRRWTEVY